MSRLSIKKQNKQQETLSNQEKNRKILTRKPDFATAMRLHDNKHRRCRSQISQFAGFYSPTHELQQDPLKIKNQQFLKKQIKLVPNGSQQKKNAKEFQTKNTRISLYNSPRQQRTSNANTERLPKNISRKAICENIHQNKNEKGHKRTVFSIIPSQSNYQISNKKEQFLSEIQIQALKLQIKGLKQENKRLKKQNQLLKNRFEQYTNNISIKLNQMKVQQQNYKKLIDHQSQQNQIIKNMIQDFQIFRQNRDYQNYVLKKQNSTLNTKLWVMQQKMFIYKSLKQQVDSKTHLINSNKKLKALNTDLMKRLNKFLDTSTNDELFQLSPDH